MKDMVDTYVYAIGVLLVSFISMGIAVMLMAAVVILARSLVLQLAVV